jgi:hypothetical protein
MARGECIGIVEVFTQKWGAFVTRMLLKVPNRAIVSRDFLYYY